MPPQPNSSTLQLLGTSFSLLFLLTFLLFLYLAFGLGAFFLAPDLGTKGTSLRVLEMSFRPVLFQNNQLSSYSGIIAVLQIKFV